MRETIREKYNDLKDNLYKDYDKVYVVDNYDFYRSNPYTIFYINHNEDFNKFEELWNTVVSESRENDLDYDDILWQFETQALEYEFDYVELGTLDIYTKNNYELKI